MATIVDVAKRAGVAVTTVSRVINDKGQVSEETRRRVLAAIRELAYRPSPAARGLPRRRLHMVSVVVPFVTNPSAVARVQGIVHGLRATNIPVGILDVETPEHLEEHFALLGSSMRPEGAVIVSLLPTEDHLASFREAGTCPVFVDVDLDDFSSVVVDDRHGGFMATQHLTELGHRRVAFIGDTENDHFGFTSSTSRRLGYRDALDEAGIEFTRGYERSGPHGRDTGHRLARELFALPEPPTAIFASSDTQAFGVLNAAQEVGLAVPQDLSIVGFDDIETAGHLGLTTVRFPLYESGVIAADLVMEHIRNPGCAPQRIEQRLELIVRSTTAQPSSGASPS